MVKENIFISYMRFSWYIFHACIFKKREEDKIISKAIYSPFKHFACQARLQIFWILVSIAPRHSLISKSATNFKQSCIVAKSEFQTKSELENMIWLGLLG